ncbi:DUF3820 family protein [Marinilongibacter aquaticus]|nr:DUF3820 family protein [Marinilongibacter aquaticus]UBM60995.1 DUF3820 family protein [Marinilongibacter aquaticus]
MNESPELKKEILREIVTQKMPFGKYKGTLLADLPISYLEWFLRKGGFPPGKLGERLATVYEIKNNGLQEILFNLKRIYLK